MKGADDEISRREKGANDGNEREASKQSKRQSESRRRTQWRKKKTDKRRTNGRVWVWGAVISFVRLSHLLPFVESVPNVPSSSLRLRIGDRESTHADNQHTLMNWGKSGNGAGCVGETRLVQSSAETKTKA